jgi:hypothetical protein
MYVISFSIDFASGRLFVEFVRQTSESVLNFLPLHSLSSNAAGMSVSLSDDLRYGDPC